jgi:hypothetical protein
VQDGRFSFEKQFDADGWNYSRNPSSRTFLDTVCQKLIPKWREGFSCSTGSGSSSARPYGTRDKQAETGILTAHAFEKSKFLHKLLAIRIISDHHCRSQIYVE